MRTPLFLCYRRMAQLNSEGARTVNLTHDPGVPVPKILGALQKIGPISRFRAERTNSKSSTLSVMFELKRHAVNAATFNHIRMPGVTLTQDKSTQTHGADRVQTREYSSRNNPLGARPSRIPRHEDEAHTRLFCKLPLSQEPEEREERFLRHFNQFGEILYHQATRDRFGRLTLGFVCYCKPEDASTAIKRSDPRYQARLAEPRKMSLLDRSKPDEERQIYHPDCGRHVDRSVFSLHENTCRRLTRLYRSRKENTPKPTPKRTDEEPPADPKELLRKISELISPGGSTQRKVKAE